MNDVALTVISHEIAGLAQIRSYRNRWMLRVFRTFSQYWERVALLRRVRIVVTDSAPSECEPPGVSPHQAPTRPAPRRPQRAMPESTSAFPLHRPPPS